MMDGVEYSLSCTLRSGGEGSGLRTQVRDSLLYTEDWEGGGGGEHTRSVTAVDVVLVVVLVCVPADVVRDTPRVSADAVDPALVDVLAVVDVPAVCLRYCCYNRPCYC
jgi:hypothetical protein